jgi:hypothetical protein
LRHVGGRLDDWGRRQRARQLPRRCVSGWWVPNAIGTTQRRVARRGIAHCCWRNTMVWNSFDWLVEARRDIRSCESSRDGALLWWRLGIRGAGIGRCWCGRPCCGSRWSRGEGRADGPGRRRRGSRHGRGRGVGAARHEARCLSLSALARLDRMRDRVVGHAVVVVHRLNRRWHPAIPLITVPDATRA